MKVSEVAAFLEADVFSGKEHLDMDVYCACGADLMSDVLAFVKHDAILLTWLVNPHAVSYTHLNNACCSEEFKGLQAASEKFGLGVEY